jgi:t-SNARE complex subunit (syntaxin)
MSNLVEAQDDLIDNISANVLNAGEFVEEAIKDLKTGKNLIKMYRKECSRER